MNKHLECKLNYANSVRPNMPSCRHGILLKAVINWRKCPEKLSFNQKSLDKRNFIWHNILYIKIFLLEVMQNG